MPPIAPARNGLEDVNLGRRAAVIMYARAVLVCALLCFAQPSPAQIEWPFGKSQEAIRLKQQASALIEKQSFAEALPLVKKSVDLERELYGEQDVRELDGLRLLAYTYYKLARYRDALAIEESRLRLSVKVLGEKHPDSITALRSVAIAYQNVPDGGGYPISLPLLEKALRLRTEVLGERHQDTLAVMTDVANAYAFTGRAAEALALYEKELRITSAAFGPRDDRTHTALLVVAVAYSNMGRDAEAVPIFQKLLQDSVAKVGEKNKSTIFYMAQLAGCYARVNRNSEALALMQRVMQLRKEVYPAKDRETINFIEILAGIYRNLDLAADALPLFAEAAKLNAADAGEKSFVTLRDLNEVARCYELLGSTEEARKLQQRVLQLRIEVLGAGHPDTIVSMVNLARVERKLGHDTEARQLYEKAVPAIEALRVKGDLSPENRQVLFAQWVDAYKAYAGLLLAVGNEAEAFQIGELSKARTLLESTAMRYANQSAVLNEEERNKAAAFEWRIAKLGDAVVAAGDRAELRLVLEADRNRAIAEFATYRRTLVAKHPKYGQLSDVKVLGADAGRALLPDEALFVSYLLDGDRLIVFTLTSRDLQAQRLPPVPALAQTIEAYRQLISRPSGVWSLGDRVWRLPDRSYVVARSSPVPDALPVKDAGEIGRYLSEKLLEPVAQRLSGSKQVIVSADGALAILPFETLPLAGTLLIADHDVSYVQSLSMLALLKSRDEEYQRRGEREDLFAMGDAIYEATKPAQTKSDTEEGSQSGLDLSKMLSHNAGDAHGVQRLFNLMHISWPNLPGTEEEISNVAQIFGPDRATVFTHQDATEAKLLQLNSQHKLADFRYLLFSAHGFLSMEEPALSALVLGQVDKAPGTDGYVTAAEWPAYDLSSDLVVLSACDTGLGKIVQGEGVMGLPYALYVAGNKNTLLTLWAVADKSTAKFMATFFAKLKAGISQSAALNQTKREFITGSEFYDPFFWAPFVLYGY
jgi:CHAT domain-containing protein